MFRSAHAEQDPFSVAEVNPQLRFLKYASRILLAGGLAVLGAKSFSVDTAELTPGVDPGTLAAPVIGDVLPSTTTTWRAVAARSDELRLPELPVTTTTTATTSTTAQPNIKAQETPPSSAVEPKPAPTTIDARSLDQRCEDAIATADVTPAPGYFLVCGPDYNSKLDGRTCLRVGLDPDDATNPEYETPLCGDMEAGETRIQPDDSDSDADWVFTVKHEVGHGYCYAKSQNESEGCADKWAHAHN